MGFRRLFHLLQDEGGNLRGGILALAVRQPGVAISGAHDGIGDELLVLLDHRVVVAAADEPLYGKEGLLRVGDGLAFRRLADEAFAIIREGDNRGRGAHALGVLDHLGRFALHDRYAGIGRTEVDTDDLGHISTSLFPAGRPGLAYSTRQDGPALRHARPPHDPRNWG
jgi:hypothetical protein